MVTCRREDIAARKAEQRCITGILAHDCGSSSSHRQGCLWYILPPATRGNACGTRPGERGTPYPVRSTRKAGRNDGCYNSFLLKIMTGIRKLSVVIPVFNEAGSLRRLHREVCGELDELGVEAEIIVVDDGSTDDSVRILLELQEEDPRITVIRFRRNFGKSAALSVGFSHATGEVIVTLDADLQDVPGEMHKLLEKLEEGFDLVSGWKRVRRDPISKRWPSKLFNWVTSVLTGVPLHDMNCGFKAYRREVVEELSVYGEMHRYIPVLAGYRGFRIAEVPVEHRPRIFGRSKYGWQRLFGGFFDLLTVIMLTRYNRKPLHIFGAVGVVLFGVGFVIEVYLAVGWFLGRWIGDRPLLMAGVLLLIVGVQFLFFGLLAEMIAYSSRKEDDYSIREILPGGARRLTEAESVAKSR